MVSLTPLPQEQVHLDDFLYDLAGRGRSPNTLRAYRLDWQHFSRWYAQASAEPFALTRLTALDVQDYVSWSKKQGFRPSTINRRLGFIKHFAAWAEESGLISPDQRRRIKKTRIVRRQALAPKSLESSHVRKLLNELERSGTARDRAIAYTLLYTGLRVGELVSLRHCDIVLSERKGTITVLADVAKGAKERRVPVPKRAREALQEYLDARETGGALPPTALVFVGRQGPISTAGVAAMLKKYAARAGLAEVAPHVLRHTFAYSYLEHNGNDLVALADILGHSDLNTTRIYTRRRLDDLQYGVEQVEFF